ncbi:MAG TPA: hypothetical protein VGS57_08545 [Thermoanaerobaculia bacterium]|jgi:hypothetical protein|nr:hypothetical protein [Thermoanaerobaculia bacterium]
MSDEAKTPHLGELLRSALGFSQALSRFTARSLGEVLGGATSALGATRPGGAPPTGVAPPAPGASQPMPIGEAPSTPPLPSRPPPRPQPPAGPIDNGKLDTSSFVVLGEGLAAGIGDFTLSARFQRWSFPAQVAVQMSARLEPVLLQPPGLGNIAGFQPLPVQLPTDLQDTVFEPEAPADPTNLAVPGYRLADALRLRPQPPLVQADARQTGCNLILAGHAMTSGAEEAAFATQVELARRRNPTLALVALGHYEVLEAAVSGDLRLLPGPRGFADEYRRLLRQLAPRGDDGAQVVVVGLFDPADTACISTVEAAARTVKASPSLLREAYGLDADDWITTRGLFEIGYQLMARRIEPLPEGCVLDGTTVRRIGERVREIDGELRSLAAASGAVFCDLHALFRRLRSSGVSCGGRQLTADYLGGIFTLNGYYPGWTGQALIANEVLEALNQRYGARFPPIDLTAVAAVDPVAAYQPAGGPDYPDFASFQNLQHTPPSASGPTSPPRAASARAEEPQPSQRSSERQRRVPERDRRGRGGWAPLVKPPPLAKPLVLPPGREQVLPLNKARSYFGDALRAVDCESPAQAFWGSCGDLYFGGLAMTDSHLSGELRIRFSEPQGNLVRFELSIVDRLVGDDALLAAPQLFRLPNLQGQVTTDGGPVSGGTLDLTTGIAQGPPPAGDLACAFGFLNTAILALLQVNPGFPTAPIAFPGQYGSTWARFSQREDGKLDFEFFGTTFVPLAQVLPGPARFPLPFAGPSPTSPPASIFSRGCALHPHIYLSTVASDDEELGAAPEIPTNTVREYTLVTHNTSFGDEFNLTGDYLGGGGTGRSQLQGRLHVQFGPRAGNTVPIYTSAMVGGGYFAPLPPTPITQLFPGRIPPGPLGFDEFLRFPLASYFLSDVSLLSDPFDLSVAAVDTRSGRILGEQLHRAFISQDVFFALIRIEPRIPAGSFYFRGPALFSAGAQGEPVYRFLGAVDLPYEEGWLFPQPNLAEGFPAGPDSSLDPFFWVQAADWDPQTARAGKRGQASDVLASNGERFSYRYSFPGAEGRGRPTFEYHNASQEGSFRLRTLTWLRLGSTPRDRAGGGFDTVTFSGVGTWSKNGVDSLQRATVQITQAPTFSYVGIQIGGGRVSNVNTKPVRLQEVHP